MEQLLKLICSKFYRRLQLINIGLIGYGYWGPNVARNLNNNEDFKFCYICDKKMKRLELAKKIYANSLDYTTDFYEVINDERIQAVALAVETSSHYDLAKKALKAGKHVYVEKPFTSTLQQAIELEQLAKERGLIVHVDHIMVYHPVIKKIKELIDSGEIGDVMYYDCSRINLGQIKNDVSSMWDLSVHDLSIIDYLSNGDEPIAINAMGEKLYSAKESITFLTLKYKTFLANITSSWLSPIKERRIMIAGTKKMIVYDDVDVLNKLIVYDKGFDLDNELSNIEYNDYVVKTRIGDAIIPKLKQEDALYNSLEHFRQCIVHNRESMTGPLSAIRMLKILEEADGQLR